MVLSAGKFLVQWETGICAASGATVRIEPLSMRTARRRDAGDYFKSLFLEKTTACDRLASGLAWRRWFGHARRGPGVAG